MNKLYFIFALHSHQPIGNFDFVFEDAYTKAYLPFLNVLQKFPNIKVTLHITGPLWDWIGEKHPEFYKIIEKLVERNQIELMGGAYYEPLICAIPEEDAIQQIIWMSNFYLKHFNTKPRGMWVAERVWEPHYPKILANAGIEYTALDDTHFLSSGLTQSELYGYYLTEHEGHIIKVFPILEKLRYTIPFRPITETMEFLKSIAEKHHNACAVFHDDGEKFGIWPGTYHSVYEEEWLVRFFETLEEEQDWLVSTTYSEYLELAKPLGRIYLPCASYHEMMEWVLPTSSQKEYLQLKKEFQQDPVQWEKISRYFHGGFWRGFLTKYTEANNMQKRMLKLSRRVRHLAERKEKHPLFIEAQKKLFQSQCNCAYWHGVFGGLYLNHLRTAIYQKIIECEKILDEIEEISTDWIVSQTMDFNCDGNPEVIFDTKNASFYISPAEGGTIFEIDYKPKSFNCLNTLMRRPEAYHDDLFSNELSHEIQEEGHKSIHELIKAKEKGLEKYLIYDKYPRYSMRDHFLPLNISVEQLKRNLFPNWWELTSKPYAFQLDIDHILLEGLGHVNIPPYQWEVKVTKRLCIYRPQDENEVRFSVQYAIENLSPGEFEAYFGSEWCFNLLTGSSEDRFLYSIDKPLNFRMLGETGDEFDLSHIGLCDDWQKLNIELEFNEKIRICNFPIETVSQSENGQERVYQGNVLMLLWRKVFQPRSVCTFNINVKITSVT